MAGTEQDLLPGQAVIKPTAQICSASVLFLFLLPTAVRDVWAVRAQNHRPNALTPLPQHRGFGWQGGRLPLKRRKGKAEAQSSLLWLVGAGGPATRCQTSLRPPASPPRCVHDPPGLSSALGTSSFPRTGSSPPPCPGLGEHVCGGAAEVLSSPKPSAGPPDLWQLPGIFLG